MKRNQSKEPVILINTMMKMLIGINLYFIGVLIAAYATVHLIQIMFSDGEAKF